MNRSILKSLFLFLTIIVQTGCAQMFSAEATNQRSDEILSNARFRFGGKRDFCEQTNKSRADAETNAEKLSNAVCGDPSKPCRHKQKGFDDWELSFQMPARLAANKTYSSAAFYAVIVKKYDEGCDELDVNPLVEPERIKLQKRFPANKVFAEYSCPNMSAVNYDFKGKMDEAGERFLYMDYIAVYAGESIEEARRLRDELLEEFPQRRG
jgi:hypothetical protein